MFQKTEHSSNLFPISSTLVVVATKAVKRVAFPYSTTNHKYCATNRVRAIPFKLKTKSVGTGHERFKKMAAIDTPGTDKRPRLDTNSFNPTPQVQAAPMATLAGTNGDRLVLVMVGLPARGKTYIARRISQYLR